MEIKKVTDASFRKYGRVLTGIDFTELLAKMQETPCPADIMYRAVSGRTGGASGL